MKPFAFLRAAAVAAVFSAALFGAAPADAQTRVFVSGQGSDSNPCSLGSPCRSFQHAHDTVLAGGEVVALDAAGYGPLTITKAVTITAIGIEASITSNSINQFGIVINAGASDAVTIRGLTLISGLTNDVGITLTSAKSVTILDTTITGFAGDGIFIDPNTDMAVELHGVTADNNSTSGLDIEPSGSASFKLLVADSSFSGNTGFGVFFDGENSTGTITATLNVAAAANSGIGMIIRSTNTASQPVVMVTGSKIVNNTAQGLSGSGNVKVLVDRTQISGNVGNGWEAVNGATVNSYKNNEVNGNGNDNFNSVVQISQE